MREHIVREGPDQRVGSQREVRPWEKEGSSLLSWWGGSTYYLEGNRDPLMSLSREVTGIDLSFRSPEPEQGLESWKKQPGDNCDCPAE